MEHKRDNLIRKIRKAARKAGKDFDLVGSTGPHDKYRLGNTTFPIPRHKIIGPKVSFEIFAALEGELGKRWWR